MNTSPNVSLARSPVVDFVTERTGLAFGEYRIAAAEAWIAKEMDRKGFVDPNDYVAYLAANNLALDDLVAGLTIGETYFFREPAVFAFLRREFLPRMKRERSQDHVLLVWSAGCASGEEAYSLAMMLEEEGWGGRAIVIGTDLSRASLVKARQATYGMWSFRGTDPSFVQRYFSAESGKFTVTNPVRERVRFQYHNLALDACPALATGMYGMDLILCRNVLMYFDPATIQRVAGRMHDSLSAGGLLITGSSDPSLHGLAPFHVVTAEAGIIYSRGPLDPVRPVAVPASFVSSAPRGNSVVRVTRAVPRQRLTAPVPAPPPRKGEEAESAFALRVRTLAYTSGPAAAAAEAGRGMQQFPLSVEIAFLRAVLPAGAGHHAQAAAAARRALYLDRFQPAVHFVLAASLWNCGDLVGARRGFRNARDLATARPAAEPIPFAEGETAGRLAAGAAAQLAMLDLEDGVRA